MENEIKVLCAYKEMVDINSLQANPLNANKHPKEQIEVFKKIILYNGVRRPITVSTRSGYITKGHGEWETLKALGMEKVPVDFQDYDSEMQEIADMNADNTLSRMSYLDTSKMQELIIKLDEANFDLELAGIPQNKVEILATQPPEWFSENPDPFFGSVPQLQNPEPKKGLVDDDEVPEVTVETDIKLGDLFQLGEHRLLCGDSTDAAQVERLMNGEKADMVFTDPPYGISYEQEHRKSAPRQTKKDVGNYFPVIKGDNVNIDFFVESILKNFGYAKKIFIWGILNGSRLPKGSFIVWDKKTEAQHACPFGDFDVCWAKGSGWKMIRSMWGGFHSKEKGEDRLHPTQKPIDLVEQFFNNWGESCAHIVDLFGGSGSTLIACEKTNRKCFMMELDPQYCQVIIDRWEKFTGQKALKIS